MKTVILALLISLGGCAGLNEYYNGRPECVDKTLLSEEEIKECELEASARIHKMLLPGLILSNGM